MALIAAVWIAVAAPAQAAPILGMDTSAVEWWLKGSLREAEAAELVHQSGAESARIGLTWKGVQRRGPNFWNWKRWDGEIAALRADGVSPLIMIHDSPRWAKGDFDCSTRHCPPHPDYYHRWRIFAAAVANRYPDATGIEVWNSPNTKAWWPLPGGVDPAHYAEVWSVAASAIHEAQPGLPVLFGSTGGAGFSNGNGSMSIPTFYSRFYRNVDRSALAPNDGLAIHAYPNQDELYTLDGRFARVYAEARQAIVDGGDLGRRLWNTEMGVTTTGSWGVSEAAQRDGLLNAIDSLQNQLDVAAVYVFTLIEQDSNSKHPYEKGYGLIHRGDNEALIPKPAYCGLEARAGLPGDVQGC